MVVRDINHRYREYCARVHRALRGFQINPVEREFATPREAELKQVPDLDGMKGGFYQNFSENISPSLAHTYLDPFTFRLNGFGYPENGRKQFQLNTLSSSFSNLPFRPFSLKRSHAENWAELFFGFPSILHLNPRLMQFPFGRGRPRATRATKKLPAPKVLTLQK